MVGRVEELLTGVAAFSFPSSFSLADSGDVSDWVRLTRGVCFSGGASMSLQEFLCDLCLHSLLEAV